MPTSPKISTPATPATSTAPSMASMSATSATSATVFHASAVPNSWLRRRVAEGSLIAVARGWYTPTPDPELPPQDEALRIARARVEAVSHTLPDEMVITGPAAALMHGAQLEEAPQVVDVLGSIATSRTRGAVHYRRFVRHLGADETREIDGITITTIERTVIETARLHGPSPGLVVADSLLRGLSDSREREATLERAQELLDGEPRHRGNAAARAVLAHADRSSPTPAVSEVRRLLLVAGLPAARLQAQVPTELGLYRPSLSIAALEGNRPAHLHLDVTEDAWDTGREEFDELERARLREAVARRPGHRVLALPWSIVRGNRDRAIRRLVLPVFHGLRPRKNPVSELDQRLWRNVHGSS